MYCIYRITNKLNNKTYIGQHKYKDLSIDEYMGSGKYLWNAYTKYGIENFEKEILISGVKTKEEINKLEIEYIKLERESGHSEYNIKDGGVGGWLMNDEIRRKLSEANKGKHLSEETKKKLSKVRKGKHHSESTRLRISESHKRENLSEETRKRRSEAMSGKNHYLYGKHHSEDTRKKMSESHRGENNPLYGKHHSEEAKKKMSEARKGITLSEETKKRISESHKGENHPLYGKHHSEETRRRLSESARLSRLGKRFYTNGIECHMYIPGEEPEGYKLGKLPKIKEDQS